jgi:protein gp37
MVSAGDIRLWQCPLCGSTARRRRRIFCLSQGDWLDPRVAPRVFADLVTTLLLNTNLIWLLLTKRPVLAIERLHELLEAVKVAELGLDPYNLRRVLKAWIVEAPPKHIWFGVSAENQQWFDRRMEERSLPGAGRNFVSLEPLLGPVNLHSLADTNWVIVGGESGPNARECSIDWIFSVVEQCRAAKVPVFVKQLGSNAWIGDGAGRVPFHTEHPKGGDPGEWPEALLVREFPVFDGFVSSPVVGRN